MPDSLSLLDLQRAVHHAIVTRDDAALQSVIVADGIGVSDRIAIHRNTVIGTLTKTLRLSHPAVHRLVGAKFFDAAVDHFLQQRWPSSALLDDFGADFAAFLEGFLPAASLPYLGDVARLEWAVHQALHAPEAAPLRVERLLQLDELQRGLVRFVVHPSLRLLEVGIPADTIWRAVLEEDDATLAAINLTPAPLWLLVQRYDAGGVEVLRTPEIESRFVAALTSGRPLQEVLDRFSNESPNLALDQLLARHLAAGRFVDFTADDLPEIRDEC